MLFSFQEFIDFLVRFLLMISFDSTMVREHTLYDFNFKNFVKIVLLPEICICLDDCSVGTWEKMCIMLLLGGVF